VSNEVTLLSGYEIEISGDWVGEPDKMYGAMATLFPENGCKDAPNGIPYTKEEYFRLCVILVVELVRSIGSVRTACKVSVARERHQGCCSSDRQTGHGLVFVVWESGVLG
jgi:hypothetical protein